MHALSLMLISAGIATAFDCSFSSTYPRSYIAYKTTKNLVIDGSLSDPQWTEVAFSESFLDINTTTLPRFDTRVKMRWDDNYLYVGAMLEEPDVWANISSVCHCLNNSQNQVIFDDNDFEIFVDPSGSTHSYKEYEMNSLNQNWDLLLNKPYGDGGSENSSRVFGPNGFDMFYWSPPLLSAAYVHGGSVNVPNSGNKAWSVEVALPLTALVYNQTNAFLPLSSNNAGSKWWRIDFSRVEYQVSIANGKYYKVLSCQSCPVPGAQHEDNWVWSQIRNILPITPTTPPAALGQIAMHNPERWGMVQFSDDPVNTTAPVKHPEWSIRSIAVAIYYAEHAYAGDNNGSYTNSIQALMNYVPDPAILDGTCSGQISIQVTPSSFLAAIISSDGTLSATIDDSRFLLVSTTV
jgi:Carbohydrate family 9 binding domain-like